jgi:hypothetical protein
MPLNGRRFLSACGFVVCAAVQPSVAQAQGNSVQAIFEKYNLIGTFAADCSTPVGKTNVYYVNRVLDANRVQRDLMESPTARAWYVIIDQARETSPNQIFLSGIRDNNQPTNGTWRIEPNRVLQWEATLGGRKVIDNGKLVSNGRPIPWLNKCAAR